MCMAGNVIRANSSSITNYISSLVVSKAIIAGFGQSKISEIGIVDFKEVPDIRD